MNINELRNKIVRANACYFYGKGTAQVDDSVYDSWKAELRKINPDDPLLTQVGAPIPSENLLFTLRHKHPMGSLNNAKDEEEFRAFDERMQRTRITGDLLYSASFKIDGMSLALYYEQGRLHRALTRGDGLEGEDVTGNAMRMHNVPYYVTTPDEHIRGDSAEMERANEFLETESGLSGYKDGIVYGRPFTGSVRGEAVLHLADWKTLDPDQLSNPRNFGNGILRRKSDGNDARHLCFYAFRLFDADGNPLDLTGVSHDECGMMETLALLGFKTAPYYHHLHARRIVEIYRKLQGLPALNEAVARLDDVLRRDQLPYEIDGLVVKVEDLDFQRRLGESGNCPRAQVAFKFLPSGAATNLLGVKITVGHTGAIIPTADLKPVKIGGVTVTSASLHNWDEIRRLGVCVEDVVLVERAGDVIPHIAALLAKGPTRTEIPEPTKCPACGGKVAKHKTTTGEDTVFLFCENPDCDAKRRGKLERWIKSLDIKGLGDVALDNLLGFKNESGGPLFRTPADFYKGALQGGSVRHMTALLSALGDSKKNYSKIRAEFEKKQKLTLAQFLGSLGLPFLGKRRVAIIQQKDPGQFDTILDWFDAKLVERAEQAGVPGIARTIQDAIYEQRTVIEELLQFITIQEPTLKKEAMPIPPSGKPQFTFAITGALSRPKKHFYDLIEAAGHKYEEDYRRGLSYLVTASKSSVSSKMKKAAKDGVPVIDEAELLELLK